MTGPLQDVNVLDLGVVGVGPWGATLLGLLGASVIKVEPPAGDRIRQQPPLQSGLATTYSVVNLTKRGSVIDLKDPTNRASVERLLEQADVVMDNVRPAVLQRLGLHWDAVRQANPSVVSVSSSAWGDQGPLQDLPGLDYHMQMMSGCTSINGSPGDPGQMLRFPHLDFSTSSFLAASVLLGLLARERTGKGQRVSTTHFGSSIFLLMTRFAEYFVTSVPPSPQGSAAAATAPHRAFRCADGRFLLVGVESDEQFGRFCRAVERDELANDPRFATNRLRVQHRETLDEILEALFQSRPSRWWTYRLEDERVPCTNVKDFEQLRFHQQVLENEFLKTIDPPTQKPLLTGNVPWDFSKTKTALRPPPAPDRDTSKVLRDGFGRPAGGVAGAAAGAEDEPPLTGLRVVDASQGYAGPFVGLLLAEAGAHVVKVEPPGGDYARGFAPVTDAGHAAAFAALNRNKESIELDLETVEGRKAFERLAGSADIVIEDWGPGVADGRGLGYEPLSRNRPGLVFCSISAFGDKGPYRDQPMSELVGQGWTGYPLNLGSPGDPPERFGPDIVGIGTGVMSFLGILAALYDKQRRGGQGQRIGISALGTMMFFRSAVWAAMTNPDRWEGDDYCNSEIKGRWFGYRAKDRPIYFNLNNCTEEQYLDLLEKLGMLEEALADHRFGDAGREAVGLGQYAREVHGIWEKYFSTWPAAELADMINDHAGAAVPMQRLNEVFEHPQAKTLGLLDRDAAGHQYVRAPWRGSWTPPAITKPPECGEHTGDVLASSGAA